MKADFEKGTKICSKCKRELPIEMFYKDRTKSDGLYTYCKDCDRIKDIRNTFCRIGHLRGNNGMLKRDYELSVNQLKKRENNRKRRPYNKSISPHGILIWYDYKLDNLTVKEYKRLMGIEYKRQKRCAILGRIGRTNPSEHFLFDFDLEQMLEDNTYTSGSKSNGREYITKWWKGEIRHWTVNDGIWKEWNKWN